MRKRKRCGVVAAGLLPSVLCMTAALADAGPPAQVAVSPSRFELEIGNEPLTRALTLYNFGNEAVEIAVSLANWDLDDTNNVRILEPTEQSLDQWIVVNPLRFSVPPRKSQTVRFSVRPRVRPAPGEHRAMIYFDQVLPAAERGKLRVRFKLGVAVYAHAGGIDRSGRLHAIEVDGRSGPVTATFDISSEGRSHVRMAGQYAIWPADRYPGAERTGPIDGAGRAGAKLPEGVLVAGRLPTKPVLPDTRRGIVLQTPAKLRPGAYVLDLNGEMPGETLDLAVPFTVPHPAHVSVPRPE